MKVEVFVLCSGTPHVPQLSQFAKSEMNVLIESSDFQKKFEAEFTEVQNWLKAKTAEFVKSGEFEPLKAYSMEKKIAKGKQQINMTDLLIIPNVKFSCQKKRQKKQLKK